MLGIRTERLNLIPLSARQLNLYLDDPEELERELDFSVSRTIVTQLVQRALSMKISKMTEAAPETHAWHTYWLIVVVEECFGAGLAGFKGYPTGAGEAEIGYGIDPAYQGRGYVTESVRALIDWAFQEPDCKSVIAPHTMKENVASNRVLKKVGMHVYDETDKALFWRIDKSNDPARAGL